MTERDQAESHPATREILLGVSLKLYLDVDRSARWAAELVAEIAEEHPAVRDGGVRLFVLPSLPAVPAVAEALAGSPVTLGAQDLHWEDRGAFTGAVSGADLYAIGCRMVEVGHAERRSIFGEDDAVVRRKLPRPYATASPRCCASARTSGCRRTAAAAACLAQLDSALAGLPEPARTEIVVAYEPVWAIGRPEPAPAGSRRCAVVAALRERVDLDARITSCVGNLRR